MAINIEALLAHDFGTMQQDYAARDAILYALGVGLGRDPLNEDDLTFLDETRLKVIPTFAVTLTTPGMWIRDPAFGVDFGKLVQIAQMAWFPNMLPPSARVTGTARIASLTDRGPDRGAVLVVERHINDAVTGTPYCHLLQTLLLRGDGGFGGGATPRDTKLVPERPHDFDFAFKTSSRAALIYRLSGDLNPLHIDPDTARRAGFAQPILHGLASYGIAGFAVSRALGKDPTKICCLGTRFASAVVPGETLSFRIWQTATGGALFQALSDERKVLDEGHIEWSTS